VKQSNEYQFLSRWRVEGTCGEVADVLGDPLALVRWWPAVYLAVEELTPQRADGTGRRVRVHTKGWLPYTLWWEFEVTESRYPHGLTLVATGDFEGRGIWSFVQDGPVVDITYDWRISAEKPLLRRLSAVLKPLFEANHRWAMAQGEESLRLELARRRATSDAARRAIPPPPGPITYAGVALIGAGVAAAAGAFYLFRRATRRSRRRDLSIP
jgi:hypothetical protein